MLYQVASVLLSPIFFVQGKYVRRVTPKLPEPEGPRHGVVGLGIPISLLVIGDSAAAGVGVEYQQHALAGNILNILGSRYEISWKLRAKTGDTSTQLLDNIRNSKPGETYDTVIISIGVNDVTGLTSAESWTNNLDLIAQALHEKFTAKRILFSSLPPMHLFPALPHPLRWWLGTRAKQLNELAKQFCKQTPNCTFISVPYPLDQRFVAADGFHPGAPAYQLWGEYLAEIMHEQLTTHI